MGNKGNDDIFRDFFKKFENLTNEQIEKIKEKNKREIEQREKANQLAREQYKKRIEFYLSKKMNTSLIYNIDFIDSNTFKSILANVAQVCIRRQRELDRIFLLSVMNTALNTRKIESFYDINEMLNFHRNVNPSVEEKKSIYEYIRCCLKEKIDRYPEMKQNAILIAEILTDIEYTDSILSNLFNDCFKR